MERDGHVARVPDPDDARAVMVRATPKGARALRKGSAQRVAALATALEALPSDQLARLADALDVLDRVLGS